MFPSAVAVEQGVGAAEDFVPGAVRGCQSGRAMALSRLSSHSENAIIDQKLL
jgi:hypothetical protein